MSVPQLLRTLRGRRIVVWNDEGKLRYRAPEGAFTAELRELVRLHRDDLLAAVPNRAIDVEPVPVSFAQHAMWFLNRTMPESPAYNVAFAARVLSPIDADALGRAGQALVDRHGTLRTLYEEEDGAPLAFVHASLPVELRRIDAAHFSEAELFAQVMAAYQRPFALDRGPLVRFDLFSIAPASHVLLISAHHIAMDGWSVWLMLDELRRLYAKESGASSEPLPPVAGEYAEYARAQTRMLEGEEGKAHWTYWEKELSGQLPSLELPTDHPRVAGRPSRGTSHKLALGADRTARIKALAREEGATVFATLLAAYAVLLSRYTGETDIIVGSPTSGRTTSRFEGVIGCFVNPVALRVRCEPTLTFRALIAQVRATVLGALAHQDYPFGLISEKLNVRRNAADGRLFQVDFALQKPQRYAEVAEAMDDVGGTIDFGGLALQLYDLPQQEGQLDLTLELIESSGALVGSFKYDASLFEPATIGRMDGHLCALLDSATADPDRPLPDLVLLPDEERRRLIVDLNATDVPFPRNESFAQYFEQQVRRTPDALAIVDDAGGLTYAELNARANRVARVFVAAGVGPDQPVALFAERGRVLVTWMLAIFKAGGAYVPLDPKLPSLRHAQILRQARPGIVVVSDALAGRLDDAFGDLAADARPRVLRAGELGEASGDATDLPARSGPESLAYIIFTSGSTGSPKGAMVPQRAMLNHFWSKIRGYGFTSTDVVAQTAPQGFDISVWQCLAVLLVGGRVRVVADAVTREPARVFDLVERDRITVLEIVPSFLRAYLDELPAAGNDGAGNAAFGALRWLIVGAEALAPDLCRRWLARWPGTPMLNTYGPSECADDTTRHLVATAPASGEQLVPIGRPIDNVRVYVLDRGLALVPQGVAGELCVGGASVGLGYLNDPERTAQSFVRDPFAADPAARLYRTGDRVRMRADGTLDFLGRIDQQVKIRGFRIELGEIESTLRTYPGIRDAAVLTKEGSDGVPRLVAFATVAEGAEENALEAQRHLRERLPEYMVPSSIVWLAALPLLPNGKVDRRTLDRLESAADAPREHVPPRAGTEERLAAVWAELLGANHIGRHDSFFQLGGHSILAARLMARLRQHLGVELPVRTLFETPTLAGLAEQIDLARWAMMGTTQSDADTEHDREQFTL